MILDSKGKLFGKVSIVDILVILIIIGGIGGVVYKYTKSKTATPFAKPDTVEIVLYTELAPDYAVNAIKEGDQVKDITNTVDLGKVIKIVPAPSRIYGFNSEGKSVVSSKEGFLSAKVTIRAQGVLYKDRVKVGSQDYYIYRNFAAKLGISSFSAAFITDIKKLEE